MAAIEAKVGNFQLNTGTGNQAVTGVGFTPKAILFFSQPNTNTIDDPDWTANYYQQVGMTDGTNSYATWAHSANGAGGLEVASYVQSEYCIVGGANASTLYYASIVSLDSDGFTINVEAAPGVGYWVGYLAIGGDDVSCKVGTFNQKTSTGSQSVTGVGFLPTGVIFNTICSTDAFYTSGSGSSGTNYPAMGFSDGTNNIGVGNWLRGTGGSTVKVRGSVQSDDYSLVAPTTSSAYFMQAAVTSLDADGFSLDWDNAGSGKVFYLAITGADIDVGSFTLPTSTGEFTAVNSLSYAPSAALMITSAQSTFDTIQGCGASPNAIGAEYTYGFTVGGDTDESFSVGAWARDYVTTTVEDHYSHDIHVLRTANNSTTTVEEVNMGAMTGSGWGMNSLTAVGSNPTKVGYFAIEGVFDAGGGNEGSGSGGADSPDASFMFGWVGAS